MRSLFAAVTAAGILALAVVAAGCGESTGGVEPPPPPPQAPRDFFGVVPQGLLNEADLNRMAEGRVGTIRLVIPWGTLDPSAKPDEGDFSTIDPIVLQAAEHGIRLLPTIYGTPDWVAEELDHRSCAPTCASFAPRSPAALAAWAAFLGELVDRYGPNGTIWGQHPEVTPKPVRAWQIWNEQNSPTFYQPAVDPASYAALLKAASTAITDRDQGAEVILGGMFGTPPPGEPAWDFLRQLYSIDDTRDYFDAVAAHPYAAREVGIEPQVRKLRDEIVRAGDRDAGIWITEVGSSSDTGPNPLELGPDGQADQLREAFDFFLRHRVAWNIEGVTWYSWRDSSDPNQCDWCPGSGLFEEDSLTPKPAWKAFASFTGGS
ncbi:MAG: polysaccharide biosynthesis protein PslG [Solirubrobacterales bacterium]|jgi:hypothetical protein|nr:polysaccharide biosynthesis protein PslG [Solirubrobacterales bacterium]